MSSESDRTALLLRVISHDLLAPLTAAKWYAEFLAKPRVSNTKREEYALGVREAAQVGISITKHIGTMARLFDEAAPSQALPCNPGTEAATAAAELQAQFDRHGVSLAVNIAPSAQSIRMDTDVFSLAVWAAAKYLLTAVGAGGSVEVLGGAGTNPHGHVPSVEHYTVTLRSSTVEDAVLRAAALSADRAPQQLDQGSVFIHLLHAAAHRLPVRFESRADGHTLMLVLHVATHVETVVA